MAVIFIGISFTCCDKEEVKKQDEYVDNGDEDKGELVNIQKIVDENVTADIKYEYYTFSLELYTHLTESGKHFAGKSNITYGVEWYYKNRDDIIYSYTLDSKNSFMKVTLVSSSHYSVIIPVFTWDDDSEKTVLMNINSLQYRALKQAEERGEKLSTDEKNLLYSLEKQLSKYINEVNAYRGKIYVEIDGMRYYVKSFQK